MRNHKRAALAVAAALLAAVAALLWWRWEAGAPERAYREHAKLVFDLCTLQPHADITLCLQQYSDTLDAWPTLGK